MNSMQCCKCKEIGTDPEHFASFTEDQLICLDCEMTLMLIKEEDVDIKKEFVICKICRTQLFRFDPYDQNSPAYNINKNRDTFLCTSCHDKIAVESSNQQDPLDTETFSKF